MIGLFLLASLATTAAQHSASPQGNPQLDFAGFGALTVYHPAGDPSGVVLFFSGSGGWNQGVVGMADALARQGNLVVGVSTPRYLKAVDASGISCSYLAGDVEQLGQFAEKALGLPQYQAPLLVGYSSGAGLVYAALAQAPEHTFRGGISLGFDPVFEARVLPCERNGLRTAPAAGGQHLLQPVSRLPAEWVVLHGANDHVWPVDSTRAFVQQVGGAQFVELGQVGHGFAVPDHWLPQFRDVVAHFTPAPAPAPAAPGPLNGLPVVDLPAPEAPTGDYFALILSGDGGWASIDRQLGDELVREGIPTAGFNSLQYFWQRRTPGDAAADLERVIRHYQARFQRKRVLLIGYSRGADVLPLLASRLPADLLDQVDLLAFLGLAHETDLEFRVGDWMGAPSHASYHLEPEMERLRGRPMLCVYGARESDTLCPDLPAGLADVVRLDGGHHFDGDYRGLAHLILDHAHRTRGSG